MSTLPNVEQNNEQILRDIQSLQAIETELLNSLETNPNLSRDQQTKITEKINQIANMRVNLYSTLSNMNSFYRSALESSVGTLQQQVVAIGIVEDELNRSKKRLQILQQEKNNKIRLIEINNYYSDNYAEHTQLMKIIIFTLIPVIILGVLNNKGILPNSFYYILLIIVAFIGAYYFWRRFASIIMRDNMNYQEYDWYFNANTAPGAPSPSSASDPWASNLSSSSGTCIGEACCSVGQTWNPTLVKCTTNTTAST
jgi:hypothetical protein